MSKLTKQITTMLLSGILVIGSASGSVFASDIDVDPGQTSEIAQEAFSEENSEAPMATEDTSKIAEEVLTEEETDETSGESAVVGETVEITEEASTEDTSETPAGAGEKSEESYSEEALAEEEAQFFTVTLDGNGGYFVNEMDDFLGEIVEQAEVVEKKIPVDGTVAAFPVFCDPDGQTMLFAGWSLEKDGELIKTGDEEYAPVDNCTLYAVWQTEDGALGENGDQEVADKNINQTETVQESEKVDAVEESEEAVTAEESSVEKYTEDTAFEANTDSETKNEQAIIADQELVYEDGEVEKTSEDSSDAAVAEEESQPELIESSEEDETVRENALKGILESGTCGDNLTWTLDEEGTLTISGTGEMINYDEDDNQWESLNVDTVVIENGVTSIGTYAFCNCSSLTSVTFPDGVIRIGDYAFGGCSKLKGVIIPESVMYLGKFAFGQCTSLASVTIPGSLKSTGEMTFYGCSNLTSVTISNGVTSIDFATFYKCLKLKSVSIPESVTVIGQNAFGECTSLISVTIPESVESIGYGAFVSCKHLISVTIPKSITVIDLYAFSGCTSLKYVYYGGTREDWKSISIQTGNEYLTNASLYFPPFKVDPVGEKIREVYPGQEVVLEVNATSGSHIYYQWFENEYECEIDGETSNSCIISTYSDADFSCHVSDDDGHKTICTFSLIVVTVENNLKAYASKWGEDAKAVSVVVNPHETVELKVTAMADEMDGLTYTWYDQDNKRIQGAIEASYQTERLNKSGIIRCDVKDKYYNVESVYFDINIDNQLLAYPDSDNDHHDYSEIYVSPGDNVDLQVVVEASDMEDIQYQWLNDQGKEIPGATDTNYSVNNIQDFTYLIFKTTDRYGNIKRVYFYIWVKSPISNAEIVFTNSTLTYTGKAIMPIALLFYDEEELFEGDDYTVSYKNNINAGLATATITGKGKYTGTKTATFKINKAVQSITASNLSLTFPNSGKISVSGNKGKLSYKSDNTAIVTVDSTGKVIAKGAGTAKITISAATTDNYNAATKTITVTVARAAQSITAKVAASSIAVDKTTTVSITGAKGTKSYKSSDTKIATVTSAGKVTAKKVGTVKITATSAATSNYKAASKAVTIKVVPAATSSLTADNQATGIKLTWKKVAGANAYFIYRGSTQIAAIKNGSTVTYTDKKANTNGTKYTYKIIASASATGRSTLSKSVTTYCVARPAISTLTNSAASKMTVKWCKNAKATGYQIQYCPDKTFKTGNKSVNVTSVSTVSKAIGSLAKGKTYYVRIRTYKTAGSTKYFSAWSAVKSVKISK